MTEHCLAVVKIDIGPVHLKQEVIVSETLQEDALIGEDIGLDCVAKLIHF